MHFSTEFFPLQLTADPMVYISILRQYEKYKPEFATITYGAGGFKNHETLKTLNFARSNLRYPLGAHVTGSLGNKENVNGMIQRYHEFGIKHLVTLKGDDPKSNIEPIVGDRYLHGIDIARYAKPFGFKIYVGAYPDKHPTAESLESDVSYLAEKMQVADYAITQFFYDNNKFIDFMELCRKKNITKPIIPGIMPLFDEKTIKMAIKLGATIPQKLLNKLEESPNSHKKIVTDFVLDQINKLSNMGFGHFHFYSLNRIDIIEECLKTYF